MNTKNGLTRDAGGSARLTPHQKINLVLVVVALVVALAAFVIGI
jgi:hypothetical protein